MQPKAILDDLSIDQSPVPSVQMIALYTELVINAVIVTNEAGSFL